MTNPVHDRRLSVTLTQIGMTTVDLSGSLRFLADVFGFQNAGGMPIWGSIMSMQGLPGDSRAFMWWLCGSQELFQIEVFGYDKPKSRRLPEDWSPNDLGWGRVGVIVSNFDKVIAKLCEWHVNIVGHSGVRPVPRRLAFRDPFIGMIWEVIEEDSSSKWDLIRPSNVTCPKILYAAASVSDVAKARRLYGELLELDLLPADALHSRDDQELWGLRGANFEGFVARAGDRFVEIFQYRSPAPKARTPKAITDQGIMNVAFGARDRAITDVLINRSRERALRMTTPVDFGEAIGAYVLEEGFEVELMNMPESWERDFGYKPAREFLPT